MTPSTHQLLVVALRDADADGGQGLPDGLPHLDVDPLQPDPSFLVRLCSTKELTDSPPSLAALVKVIEECIHVRPTPGIKLQGAVLEFVSPKQHGEEFEITAIELHVLRQRYPQD